MSAEIHVITGFYSTFPLFYYFFSLHTSF